jgi:hypothetical protein
VSQETVVQVRAQLTTAAIPGSGWLVVMVTFLLEVAQMGPDLWSKKDQQDLPL